MFSGSVRVYSEETLFSIRKNGMSVITDVMIQQAKNGDGKALYDIAEEHRKRGELSKAFTLYQRSATQKNSDAQTMLGRIYSTGLWVLRNYDLAIQYYLKAIKNDGNKKAQFWIGGLYQNGNGVHRDIHRAIEYYTQAALQGHLEAYCSLGWVYKTCDEVKDLQKSVNWYKKAADNGNIDAKKELKELNSQGYYPKEEHTEYDQETTNTVITNKSEENRNNEKANNNCEQEQSTSAIQNVEQNVESLKEQIKELDIAFQLNSTTIQQEIIDNKKKMEDMEATFQSKISLIEEECINSKSKIKEMEENFQSKISLIEQEIIDIKEIKIEKQNMKEQQKEEINQLMEALAESRAALEDYQAKVKEMEAQQKEKDEEIKILKAALAYFSVDKKDKSEKNDYY